MRASRVMRTTDMAADHVTSATREPAERSVAADAPRRRGPRPRRFTKTQEMLLRYIAGETVLNGEARCTKQELADRLGRNVKTVDRCISALRREGLIEIQMNFDERGAQLSSSYRIASRPNPLPPESPGALVALGDRGPRGVAPTKSSNADEAEPSSKER